MRCQGECIAQPGSPEPKIELQAEDLMHDSDEIQATAPKFLIDPMEECYKVLFRLITGADRA